MKTVNNDPRINCPNANWNGVTTNYCNGVTSDDVVAHEWGHAYTSTPGTASTSGSREPSTSPTPTSGARPST